MNGPTSNSSASISDRPARIALLFSEFEVVYGQAFPSVYRCHELCFFGLVLICMFEVQQPFQIQSTHHQEKVMMIWIKEVTNSTAFNIFWKIPSGKWSNGSLKISKTDLSSSVSQFIASVDTLFDPVFRSVPNGICDERRVFLNHQRYRRKTYRYRPCWNCSCFRNGLI